MKKIVCLFFITSSIFSMQLNTVHKTKKIQIKNSAIFAPEKLGHIKLYHDEKGFYVLQNNTSHPVQKCFTDPVLRTITPQQLSRLQRIGYIVVNQMTEGDFSLTVKVRGSGTGFVYEAIAGI